MALELGLGEPPITRTTKDSTSLGVITSTFDYGPQATKGRIDTTAIECQRILVACYLTCSR